MFTFNAMQLQLAYPDPTHCHFVDFKDRIFREKSYSTLDA